MNVSLATLSLTHNLQKLEGQIAAAPALLAAVRCAMREPDVDRLVQARLTAGRHLSAMAMTTRQIRIGVIGVDDLDLSLESLSELVLRAVRLVVLSELTILRELWRGRDASQPPRAVIEGRLDGIDAVDARLRDELDGITSAWWRFRGAPNPDRSAYRTALRAAHRATRALVEDREVAQFLDAGSTGTDWPAFCESCARLKDALLVRIDVEPDAALLEDIGPPARPCAEHAP